eukprot:1346797-Pleurochrysis_carterae.AAC.1
MAQQLCGPAWLKHAYRRVIERAIRRGMRRTCGVMRLRTRMHAAARACTRARVRACWCGCVRAGAGACVL